MDLSSIVLVLKTIRHESIGIDDTIYEVRASLDHTLVDELLEWLLLAYISEVEEELVPETRVDEVTCSMLGTTDIEVHVSPVLVCLAAYKGLVVVRIHIAEIVRAAACESRHCAEFDRIALVCPVCRTSERWLTRLCRKVLVYLRELERKLLKCHRSRDTVLEVHRERLTPISLTREDSVTETIIDLSVSDAVLLYIIDGSRNSLLYCHSVQEARVAHDSFLRVEA